MKTIALVKDSEGALVTLELNELELTTLAALVEQGQRHLSGNPRLAPLHSTMHTIADEFRSVLGHLELLVTSD